MLDSAHTFQLDLRQIVFASAGGCTQIWDWLGPDKQKGVIAFPAAVIADPLKKILSGLFFKSRKSRLRHRLTELVKQRDALQAVPAASGSVATTDIQNELNDTL